jgi:peroxiredoxin
LVNLTKKELRVSKFSPGDIVPNISTTTIAGKDVSIPDSEAKFVHLQFRRFVGCPVCLFHLQSLGLRANEIAAKGIHEVVFFHSSREEMLNFQAELPFDCIADPEKSMYRQFGVETSWLSPIHPAVLWPGLRKIFSTGRFHSEAENGIFGLPADFLIDPKGKILACHYGKHAYDNWDANKLLQLAI